MGYDFIESYPGYRPNPIGLRFGSAVQAVCPGWLGDSLSHVPLPLGGEGCPPCSRRSVLVTYNTNVKFRFLSGLVCMCAPVLVDAAHMGMHAYTDACVHTCVKAKG